MDGRSTAWLAYVPLPGLALVPLALHPGDRLARYHAWQGTALVLALLTALFLLGLLTLVSPARGFRLAVGLLSGAVLLAGAAQLAWGAAAAARGRCPRLRPAWDACAALRRLG